MKPYLHSIFTYFGNAAHPAAGKLVVVKTKKRTSTATINPKATPDSLNIREMIKKQDGFRRNPAP